ncbi:MAG: glycosyltransferase family 2 protein [bacterium]
MLRKIELLSIVVPCHNEEEPLKITHYRLTEVLESLLFSKDISNYEIIFVDNGSTDSTLEVLKNIFALDEHTRIISLRANFDYQGSITAGLFHARGDVVITIDADLQDPPEKIKEMLEWYKKGYDLVLGVRENRSVDCVCKRFFSGMYYRFLKFLGVNIVYNHGDFRLMSGALVNEFNKLPERNRFIRGMILQLESRYAIVKYKRERRKAGKSKFGALELFSLATDGIVSFSYVPLKISSVTGVIFFFLGLVGALWVLYIKIFTNVVPGWASTVLPIFFIGGVQLFFLGLIGEYIGKLYVEVKRRPLFLVREEYTHSDNKEKKTDETK